MDKRSEMLLECTAILRRLGGNVLDAEDLRVLDYLETQPESVILAQLETLRLMQETYNAERAS